MGTRHETDDEINIKSVPFCLLVGFCAVFAVAYQAEIYAIVALLHVAKRAFFRGLLILNDCAAFVAFKARIAAIAFIQAVAF